MRQRLAPVEGFQIVDKLLGDDKVQSLATTPEPLDEQEQEAVIREFEIISSQEHRRWRNVFGYGSLAAGLFFLYAACRQYVEPFGVRYTGELQSVTASITVAVVLATQGLSLLLSAAGLLSSVLPPPGHRGAGCLPFAVQQRAALWAGVVGAAVCAAYWVAALVRMVQLHGQKYGVRWELCWLPGGPLAACLLCCYVAATLSDTERDIQRLRSYRYRYKKA